MEGNRRGAPRQFGIHIAAGRFHRRRGNQVGAAGMLVAIVVTWINVGTTSWWAIVIAMLLGGGRMIEAPNSRSEVRIVPVRPGAVGIRRIRHTLGCALIADVTGIVASIAVCYWFFG